MVGFSIDDSEFRELAADLGKVPSRLLPEVDAVLKRGANNLKGSMRAAFEASPHFRRVGGKVSYDSIPGVGTVGYEVGPTIGGAGSLAGIAVDGGANGGGGSVQIDDLLPAEADVIEKHVGEILEGML